MKQLFLEDLKDLDEAGVKAHIAKEYSDEGYGDVYSKIVTLEDYNVIIAYESVGSWGCDSSSYFLLQHKETGALQEISGCHCSCHGFEGQFNMRAVPIEYLKSDKFHFYCGGYDDNETENQKAVKEFLGAF